MRHGFEPPNEGAQVKAFFPASAGGFFEFPKYVIDGFSYTIRPDMLMITFEQSDAKRLSNAELIAARLLRTLSHTPITGVGHNFEFRDPQPSANYFNRFTEATRDLLDQMPEGWSAGATTLSVSIKNKDGDVFCNIARTSDAGTIIVKFNFHHPVTSAEQAVKVLDGNGYSRMVDNLGLAQTIIKGAYGNGD
jgi:hypothetical protein